MSSDSESKVVVAGSNAEDIVQRKKVKRSSVWEHFQEKDDIKAECTHCCHEFKTKYANTTGLLRHIHPNISTCTRKKLNRYKICRTYKMMRERLLNRII